MNKENLAKAEEIYDLITRLEDWTGGRQKEANIARIAQALQKAEVSGAEKVVEAVNNNTPKSEGGKCEIFYRMGQEHCKEAAQAELTSIKNQPN